jgi:hypothetical protein
LGKVTVYRYQFLSPTFIGRSLSQRWGTRLAITNLLMADIVEASAMEVDEAVLNPNGFTPLDYKPRSP